jgi:uncharacterized hydrophobic protein (TIGR00271 family)
VSKIRKETEAEFLDQVRFSRGLSLWRAMSRAMGVILAGVVFVLLGEAATIAGPFTALAILLAALLVVVNNLGYVELDLSVARPGGAYTLVYRGQENAGLAFLTGWVLALSGLGLCGLLARGAAHHLGLLLADLLGLTVPTGVLGMGLVILVALQSCLGGRIGRRLPFALPLVMLLVILALLGTSRLPSRDYETTYFQPYSAAMLLLTSFVGMEIVTGHQDELRHRAVNLPRALLGAPVLAAGLGAVLVALVGSCSTEMTATPMVPWGRAIAGTTGQVVMTGVGLVALILSLDQGLTMIVRHLYVMSRDGFWPAALLQTHSKRGMPVGLILLVSLLILPTVWIPVIVLSQVSGLLYLSALMAVNLTLALRPRQTTRGTFALPFHPWVPALTLAIDFLVISLWGSASIAWAVCCLVLGGLVYLAYERRRHLESQEGVTIFRPPAEKRAPEAFRALVPVTNPATADKLLRTAGRLAQAQDGKVLALQIIVVPEPVPLEAGRRRAQDSRVVLENALALANKESLPIQTMTRIARSVAHGILDAAADEGADIIVLGWSPPTRARAASLGSINDAVLRGAQCDVLVVRGGDVSPPESILVPTAGGPHAHAAARLALLLAETSQSEVTLLCIQSGPATPRQMEENRCLLAETVTKLAAKRPPQQKVVQAPSVVEGIVQEAQQYDLLILGVSEESLLDQIMFGSIPLQIAARVPATILVQAHRGLTGLWIRRLIHTLQDALPILSGEEILEVQQELAQGARPGTDYFVLIVLSCIIATLGLLQSSPAVVIGAMLVAPLMSPIMAFSLGLVRGDLRLIRFAAEATLKGVALAILIAAFVGLLSPLRTITSEMLARTQPNLLDLAVALASGMAGAYALARKEVSAALPGVAIAAALMPPLATAGLGLTLGDARVAGGAFLLFVTNIAAISLAGGIVFLFLGIRPQAWGPESRRRLRQRLFASLLLLLAIALPLGAVMGSIVRDAAQKQAAQEVLAEFAAARGSRLVDLEVTPREADLLIIATLQSAELFDHETVNEVRTVLSGQLGSPVQLEVVILPTIRSTPLSLP